MSDWLEPQFLDHLLGVSAFSAPSALYLGLSTASGGGFGDDGTGTESSLARQSISFSAPSNTSISSSSAIEYPRITGSAETIYGWGVFDAATGGNLLYHSTFPASTNLSIGDSFIVPAGSVSISYIGALQPYAFKAWSDHCLRNTSWTMPSKLYLALDRTGTSLGDLAAPFSTLSGSSFDEPRWHDHSTGTVTNNTTGTPDQQNASRRAGVINGSGETYGGYQRCRLVYNAASNGSASLDYSVTRDDGLWYNDQPRNNSYDFTNSRRLNWGKTELRKWTDRVEFPIAGNVYTIVGGGATAPYGAGVLYSGLGSWAIYKIINGQNTVVTGSASPEYLLATAKHFGVITGWGIFDSETPQTGNLLMRGTFASNIDATAHKDVVRIPASSYTVTAA